MPLPRPRRPPPLISTRLRPLNPLTSCPGSKPSLVCWQMGSFENLSLTTGTGTCQPPFHCTRSKRRALHACLLRTRVAAPLPGLSQTHLPSVPPAGQRGRASGPLHCSLPQFWALGSHRADASPPRFHSDHNHQGKIFGLLRLTDFPVHPLFHRRHGARCGP